MEVSYIPNSHNPKVSQHYHRETPAAALHEDTDSSQTLHTIVKNTAELYTAPV